MDGEEEEEGHDVVLTVVATGLVRREEEGEELLLDHGEKEPMEDLDPLVTAVEEPSRDGRRVTRVDGLEVQSARFEKTGGLGHLVEEQHSYPPELPSNPV